MVVVQPFYEYLDHTADIQLHSSGHNFEEALIQIGYALINYMTDLEKVECEEEIRIHVEGYDEPSLVYAFLDELLYQFSGEQFVSKEIQILDISQDLRLQLDSSSESHHLNHNNNNGIKLTTTANKGDDITSTNQENPPTTFSSNNDDVQEHPPILPTSNHNDNNEDGDGHDDDNKRGKEDTQERLDAITSSDEMANYQIDALLKGERWNPEKHLPGTEIKAITYSNMQIHRTHDKTDIYVIVDI
jgi:SHS2 domain-containing protein